MCEFLRLRASEFAHPRKKLPTFGGKNPGWPVNHPLTYFFEGPLTYLRWPNTLTYFRWPTFGDHLSRWPRRPSIFSYDVIVTLIAIPHIAHIPLSYRIALIPHTTFFQFFSLLVSKLSFFMMKILVHGSSKGLFCGPFRVCLFCFNFFYFSKFSKQF